MGDRYEKGLKLYHALLGKEVHQSACQALEHLPELENFAVEFMYGDIYDRPVLDLRTREIIVITALIVQQQEKPLKFHLQGAQNFGITEEEIAEIILQCLPIIGFPAATTTAIWLKEAYALSS